MRIRKKVCLTAPIVILTLLFFIVFSMGRVSAQHQSKDDSKMSTRFQKVKEELMRVDRAFSKLSLEKGSVEAFYYYMAGDGIVLPKKGHPVNKNKYREIISQKKAEKGGTTLTWEPVLADVSESADIGYTHGKYEFIITDSTGVKNRTYGYYVTIWKRQADGSWKFVFDTGNEIAKKEKR